MQNKTLAYKFVRSASWLLGVLCLFFICHSNFTYAAPQPAKTEITVAKECSNHGLETVGGEDLANSSSSHARHVHQRSKKVRRVLEEFFVKESSQSAIAGHGRLADEDYIGFVSFHSPDDLVRPFYYVQLYRDALF